MAEESEVAPSRSSCSGGGGSSSTEGDTGTHKVTRIRTRSNLELYIKNSSDPVKVKVEAMNYTYGPDEIQVMETDGNVFTADTVGTSTAPLNLGGTYNTVRAARRAASSLRQLNPDHGSVETSKSFSFANGDGRTLQCHMEHNLKDRLCKSFSFDPQTRKCDTCPSGGHAVWKSAKGSLVAIIGTDQAFPACLPETDGNECARIVRVEDRSLQEIVHALADAIGGTGLAKGTVFLIGSLSHLCNVGTGQYLTDWVRTRHWLRTRFGEHCMVLPLLPLLVQGGGGQSTVRSVIETLHWFISLSATEAVLMKGIFSNFIHQHLRRISGQGWGDCRQVLRVPGGLDTKAFVSLVSEGWGERPGCLPPLSQEAEGEIILNLMAKLNEAFELNLCEAPCTARTKSDLATSRRESRWRKLFAVVGGSHAGRLRDVLFQRDSGLRPHRTWLDTHQEGCRGEGCLPDIPGAVAGRFDYPGIGQLVLLLPE